MKSLPSSGRAAIVSLALSALFLVVYGGCNWITTHRTSVGMFHFAWERNIPFVPLLIPAYMSLDLFFIGAPFLCSTDRELRLFAGRVTTAILAAGACFLLWPLRFAFDRPVADGVIGAIFNWFRGLDAPYNLAPSLHAALLLIVADVYVRHLHGAVKVGAIAWFVLIGLSPILTWQHHVTDIAMGFGLAVVVFYFFPMVRQTERSGINRRIACYYGLGAVAFAAGAVILNGRALLFLWPAISLAIVAAAYFRGGSQVYHKTNGQVPWSSRVVLAPCLLGQHLSLVYYRSQWPAWDKVTPRLWMGGRLSSAEAEEVLRLGVVAVLDLTAEFSERKRLRNQAYCNIPVLDLTAPTQDQLLGMVRFISEHVRTGIVYVHCKIGFSRSAAAVAAYLLVSRQAKSVAHAFAMVERARPCVVIRPEIHRELRRFQSIYFQPVVSQQTFVLASERKAFA